MSRPIPQLLPALALVCLLAPLVACGSGESAAAPESLVLTVLPGSPSAEVTASPSPLPSATSVALATSTPVPAPPSTATSAPATTMPLATATPSATTSPATAQTGAVQFKPAQIVQGGAAVVYLMEPATAATARFGGLLYPMLQDGNRWWAVLGVGALATPGAAPVTVSYTPAGQSATVTAAANLTILDRDFPVERIDLSPQTSALLAPDIITAELNQRAAIHGAFTAQRLWSGPFVRPNAAAVGDIYGIGRSYNGAPVTDYHRGVDFTGQSGSPVVAAAAGRVAFAGELKVRGNSVYIDHGAGVFTGYHHFSRIDVAQGQMVTLGQQIGLVGDTGLVTGPHLHWEVLVRSVEVDGELWLKGTEVGP